jgi:hypothetical protein
MPCARWPRERLRERSDRWLNVDIGPILCPDFQFTRGPFRPHPGVARHGDFAPGCAHSSADARHRGGGSAAEPEGRLQRES